ncbi:hypothetical protein QBC39DRAFT_175244 [Podospora conica]|nr:hypothetical protein QBC39DRAFT_175244 [Schizothecium conicum]
MASGPDCDHPPCTFSDEYPEQITNLCRNHRCRIKGCLTPGANRRNQWSYCDDHWCLECANISKAAEESGSSPYCSQHYCRGPDCPARRDDDYGFCGHHVACGKGGCRKGKDPGERFCLLHLDACAAPGCVEERHKVWEKRTRVIKYRTFRKNKTQDYWAVADTSEFCSKDKCRGKTCLDGAEPGRRYCPDHDRCGKRHCTEARQRGESMCPSHREACYRDDCLLDRVSGPDSYCNNHGCAACGGMRDDGRRYCTSHSCPYPQCGEAGGPDHYCDKHSCVACVGPRKARSRYCARHDICLYGDCHKTCTLPATACRKHRCQVIGETCLEPCLEGSQLCTLRK